MLVEAVIVILSLVYLYFTFRKPPGLPPGMWGLPIVGKFPSTSVRFGDQVKALRPRYGDLISWRVGNRLLIFLCNQQLIKRALSKQEFTDRPDFSTFFTYAQGGFHGVIFGNGVKWQIHRRFVLRHLRNLGMGKSKVELDIQEEAVHLVEDFKKHTDKDETVPMSLGVAVFNVIWKMVAGTRFRMDDQRAHDLVSMVWSINDTFQGPVTLFNFFPWLENWSPKWLKEKLGLKDLQDLSGELFSIAKEYVKLHEDKHEPNKEGDLIDQYLSAMKEEENEDSILSVKELLVVVLDLFVAGLETTSSTLRWAILYLAKYPEIQRRVQREIDNVLPRGTKPQYQDRAKLPYFEAVLNEVNRISSLVPLGVPHMASQDTQLEGYIIPKGAVLLPHLECSHKDPELWEKPDQFYPEHFLDAEGKFVPREGLMPFAVGRRVCLGESLARVEIVVFLAALLQNFTFIAPEGEPLSTENDPKEFSLNSPKPYRITIRERKSEVEK
ncbi:cytochrome P450 2L1-like [Portunus trituberculatus]|uniref:cytochrome P450 2L1-like n=1 Tax=Portunus trituberculatus TaxID=210409 RepID=UPI001E1D1FD9|nr:cytochrome P450 2L1-like [Portunus trituberculatus]